MKPGRIIIKNANVPEKAKKSTRQCPNDVTNPERKRKKKKVDRRMSSEMSNGQDKSQTPVTHTSLS